MRQVFAQNEAKPIDRWPAAFVRLISTCKAKERLDRLLAANQHLATALTGVMRQSQAADEFIMLTEAEKFALCFSAPTASCYSQTRAAAGLQVSRGPTHGTRIQLETLVSSWPFYAILLLLLLLLLY